ncbi:hypothetical protein [Neochlamydia sp. S13]|uniref:hypothetical protein n=1 Tax=Neochlamydia sp. S13 TaxID=1353976 RepID=UPI000FD16F84|nr:hypothetical protein [Neochlamydia sp. S13]BBI16642.1 hypothetical protein NCS13_1_0447 [Neochlamydia sp. S13]
MPPSRANLPNKKSARDKALTIWVVHLNGGGSGFGTKALYPLKDFIICPAGDCSMSIHSSVAIGIP